MNNEEIEDCQQITTEHCDLKHLVNEIEFEIKEYADQIGDGFVILHDTTVYKVMLLLHMLIGKEEGKSNARTPQQIIGNIEPKTANE